jgi:aminopeptidase N
MIDRTRAQLLACMMVLGCAAAAPSSGTEASGKPVVLPAEVSPQRYRIEIVPDAQARNFAGTVEIELTVHQATDRIVLNSAGLRIESAALSGERAMPTLVYDDEAQTASFLFGHPLKVGAHTLRLEYRGRIYEQASGLFSLDYETSAGKRRALFTQFENSDARRFVPSWDEPARKAVFELTATLPAEQVAVSNMPIARSEPLPGARQRVHFEPTPKMSSYLLFFGMGDFERVHRSVDGVDLGVVVKRGDTAQAAYALDAAADILPYYNHYFGTPFPLPKLDMIAGPGSSQFFGAMENWGAIFYFERVLLVDPRLSTESDRQRVYQVVAHEMAHQWFGDLVTMAWWDGLWLNEGFASWMQNKVMDKFHPEWHVWLQGLNGKQAAMGDDARDGTHPIITPIHDVLQASGAFDSITYVKGAAVIRTLESYLGEDAFGAGVRAYIRDHAYGNAVTDDLWQSIDHSAQDGAPRHPITQIAHDLTLQAGVPMIGEVSAQCHDGRTTVALAQGRFAIDQDSSTARLWHVPVRVATLGAAPATMVVSGAGPTLLEVEGCGAVILNTGQTAYFRSRYSDDGLAAIVAQYGALSSEDQLGVLNDMVSLAYIGETPIAAFLDLAKRFPGEADPVVIASLVGRLRSLDHLYDGLPTQERFRSYARGVLNPFFARLGWDKAPGEGDNTSVLRGELIGALGAMGDAAVLADARKRFDRYVADPASLDASKRRSVLRLIATHADAASWDRLHAMAATAKTQVERQELYGLLAAARDPVLAQQALDLALGAEPSATTKAAMISSASFDHPALVFDFVVAHWDAVAALLEPTAKARFVPRLVANASDAALIDKLRAFAVDHIPAGAHQDLRKSIASIRYLAAIRNNRLPEVDRWLKGQGS